MKMRKYYILLLLIIGLYPALVKAEVPKPTLTSSVKMNEIVTVVVLSWTMPSAGNWGYRVYNGENESSKKVLIDKSPSTVTSETNSGGDYIDTDVDPDTVYNYFVSAYNIAGEESGVSSVEVDTSKVESTTTPSTDQLTAQTGIGPFNNIGEFISKIMTNYAVPFALMATLFMIIFAGYNYITSGGAPEQVTLSKEIIVGALLGLATILLFGWLLASILPG